MISPLARLEGKYEILEKIQEGGMGAIYKVRHLLLDEPRVIKVMRPHLQQDPSLRERFLAEGRAAARLNHPNIARIFDCTIDEEGVAYLVMEFIPGWTLGDLLRRGELLPLPLVLEIARQSLAAIGHMHLHKMVHRDVAPDNLILGTTLDGRPLVKLIDLGIAKATEGGSHLTDAGVFVGKFRYAAPELFEETSTRNEPRSDLYSMALVLYELSTLQFPIAGTTSSSLIAGHLFRPPLGFDISDPDGRLDDALRQALLRGLAKTPEERFATAQEFAAALPALRLDTTDGKVKEVLDLTEAPRPADIVSMYRPGSTQARFDAQFAPLPTPAPLTAATPTLSADAMERPTELIPSVAAQLGPNNPLSKLATTDPNASTVILLPDADTQAPGDAPPPASGGGQRATQLLAEARQQAAREDFTGARNVLDKLLAMVPDHPQASQLRNSLDALQEVQLEETRQTEIISRRDHGEPPAGVPRGPVPLPTPHPGAPVAPAAQAPKAHTHAAQAPAVQAPAAQASRAPSAVSAEPPTETVATPAKSLDDQIADIREMQRDGRVGDALQAMRRCVQEHGSNPQLKELRNELGLALLAQDAEQQEAIDPYGTVPSLRSSSLDPAAGLGLPADGSATMAQGTTTPVLHNVPTPPPVAAAPPAPPSAVPTPSVNTAQIDDLLTFDPGTGGAPGAPTGSTPAMAEMTLDGRTNLTGSRTVDAFDASPTPPASDSSSRSATLPARQNQRSMLVGGIILVVLFALLGVVLSRYRPEATPEVLPVEDVIAAQLSPGFLSLDIRPWGEIHLLEDQNQEQPTIQPSRNTPVLMSLPPGTYRVSVHYPPQGIERELTLEIKSGETTHHLEVFHPIDSEAYFRAQ